MENSRYMLTLDLVDDPSAIAAYEAHHRSISQEIRASIRHSGVVGMDIYRFGSWLCMIMEVDADFTFQKKAEMDQANLHVQRWERLMWKFQRPVPGAKAGEKWVLMEQIFSL